MSPPPPERHRLDDASISPFVSVNDPIVSPRWNVEYLIDPGTDRYKEAVAVERQAFISDLGYSPELMASEYDPYDDLTIMVAVTDTEHDRIVGVLRALVGPTPRLKMDNDLRKLWGMGLQEALALHGCDPDAALVECSSLAVLPDWRRLENHWALKAVVGAYEHLIIDVGGEYSVQLQDTIWPRLIEGVLGLPLEVLAGLDPQEFLGPVVPTITHVAAYDRLIEPGSMDPDYAAYRVERDQTLRGGTRLPTLDLSTIDLRNDRCVIDLRVSRSSTQP